MTVQICPANDAACKELPKAMQCVNCPVRKPVVVRGATPPLEKRSAVEQEPAAEIVADEKGYLTTRWTEHYYPSKGDKLYTQLTPGAVEQGKRQPQWLPIADAPRDGNLIDLWCVPPDDSEFEPTNGGIRLTGSWHDSNDIFPHTGWVRVMDDGNWDLINSPPLTLHGLPRWIPIYWRAEPLPPTATPQGKL